MGRLLLIWIVASGVTLAQAAPAAAPSARAQAKVEYEAGVVAFKAARYEVALERFEAAFQLDPSPVLLFNLGRVHEERGDTRRAIAHFERYLARVPKAADRGDVEARLARLRATRARQRASGANVPPWVAWSSLGLAVAGVTTGAVFLASAADARDEAEGLAPTLAGRVRYDDLQSRFERDRALGWIGLAAGAAFAATGVALLVWGGAEDGVALRPTLGGAALGGTF